MPTMTETGCRAAKWYPSSRRSGIGVVESPENRSRNNPSRCHDGARDRRLEGPRPVRPFMVVITDELPEDRAQALLVDDDQVVEALGPEGSPHPLADGVRPRASERCSHSGAAHPGETGIDVAPVDGIAIVDEMSGLPTPGRRLQELAPDPGGGRARGDPDLHQLPPSVPDEEEDVQGLVADGLDHEQIGGRDALERCWARRCATSRQAMAGRSPASGGAVSSGCSRRCRA